MKRIRLYSILLLVFVALRVEAQIELDVNDPEQHHDEQRVQDHASEPAFDFETDGWKKIQKTAKLEKRKIFVLFLSDNCESCDRFENEVLTNVKLAGLYSEQFLLFKPAIGSKQMTDMVTKYHINSFPTALFVDGYGNVIHKYIGYISEEDMVNMAENVSQNRNTLKYYKAQYKKFGRKMPVYELYDYALVLMHAGEDNKAIVKAYFRSQPEGELMTGENVRFIMLFTDQMYSREFIFFAKNSDALQNSLYTQADYNQKIEDVISGSLIKSMQKNKKIVLNDTLEKTLDFFEIRNQDAIISRVTMDYYDVVVPNKQKYFEAVNNYLLTHMESIDFALMAEKVQRVADECDDKAIIANVIVAVTEAISNSSEFSEDLYAAYIDLLLKDNRREEAEDQVNIMMDRISTTGVSEEEVSKKYEYYYQRIRNNPDSKNLEGDEEIHVNE